MFAARNKIQMKSVSNPKPLKAGVKCQEFLMQSEQGEYVHLLLFINAKYAFIFVYRRSIARRHVHLRRGAFI